MNRPRITFYQVPHKTKEEKKRGVIRVRTRSGKIVKKVPIQLRLGRGKQAVFTFYVQRRWVLLFAGLGAVTILGIGAFLYWLWYVRIPQITGG